ncbi:hypothetical protein [Salisediminibacterium selenitireducens]|uniref:hypothetical protein n=1 Tax=Salisediminibacterium selenitireducens TaxID=85683 RepID=UPI0012D74B2E|nr:hypothetical protein [Salisediminibacterium selenitireducens]
MILVYVLFLFSVPAFVDMVHSVLYLIAVAILSFIVIRRELAPEASERAFMAKWIEKRKRSVHVNGLINAGLTFVTMAASIFIVPFIVDGRLMEWSALSAGQWTVIVLFLAVFSLAPGYVSVWEREKRYDKLVVKHERMRKHAEGDG